MKRISPKRLALLESATPWREAFVAEIAVTNRRYPDQREVDVWVRRLTLGRAS